MYVSLSDADKETCMLTIKTMLHLAEVSRFKGVLALEMEVQEIESIFLKTGIMLICDGNVPEIVERLLQNLIEADEYVGVELLVRKMMMQGVLAIQMGENLRILELRLRTLLGEKYLTPFEGTSFIESPALKGITEFISTIIHKEAYPESLSFERRLSALNSRDMYKLFGCINTTTYLIPALHGCSGLFVNTVMQNISVNLGAYICHEWERSRPNNKEHCISTQTHIINVLDRLIEEGEIIDISQFVLQEGVDRLMQGVKYE